MLIKDRVAVITGIGPGMGREIALAFAQNGAKLAIGARNIAFVDKVAAQCVAAGAEVVALRTDIADRASCEAIVQAATDRFGGDARDDDWALRARRAGAPRWTRISSVRCRCSRHACPRCARAATGA